MGLVKTTRPRIKFNSHIRTSKHVSYIQLVFKFLLQINPLQHSETQLFIGVPSSGHIFHGIFSRVSPSENIFVMGFLHVLFHMVSSSLYILEVIFFRTYSSRYFPKSILFRIYLPGHNITQCSASSGCILQCILSEYILQDIFFLVFY